jgi:RimJ/RimL family protein N-acetyltransferase
MPDDLALMRIQVDTLFTHDAKGRMVRVNEPDGKAAPRFFLGRTAKGKVWRFRHDIDDALARELESACRREADGDDFAVPPHGATPYEELLARAARIERRWAGPAYRFPEKLPTSSGTVAITPENIDLLRPHLEDWLGDIAFRQPAIACIVNGSAVSVCCSVRILPVADEAGVDTAEAFRGRGYASRVVSAWASAVRTAGRIPLYSTSWENRASLAVARKLGLVRFGTDLHIT